jgi:hypothetical protein
MMASLGFALSGIDMVGFYYMLPDTGCLQVVNVVSPPPPSVWGSIKRIFEGNKLTYLATRL